MTMNTGVTLFSMHKKLIFLTLTYFSFKYNFHFYLSLNECSITFRVFILYGDILHIRITVIVVLIMSLGNQFPPHAVIKKYF